MFVCQQPREQRSAGASPALGSPGVSPGARIMQRSENQTPGETPVDPVAGQRPALPVGIRVGSLFALVPPLLRWNGKAGALRRGRIRAQSAVYCRLSKSARAPKGLWVASGLALVARD